MRNRDLLKLLAGFRRFREKYFAGDDALKFSGPQSPKTLIIACSDSRVDPALVSSAGPGELFVVRNVANLVPPYESALTGRHGVSAAIEFAVVNLRVENIIVMGHRQCGGIRALMSGEQTVTGSFVGMWMEMLHGTRDKILAQFGSETFDVQCRECEREGIVNSLANLRTFPFVSEALARGVLNIYGVYFDLEQGQLMEYDEVAKTFNQLPV